MKRLLILLLLLAFTGAKAQYYYLPYATFGNPGGINNYDEYPVGGGLDSSWTSIHSGSTTVPQWTSVQTLPFTFQFNGSNYTQYKVSTSGVLTFTTSAVTAPTTTTTTIPSTAIPDNSVMIWGLEGAGANDNIVIQTLGTSPNRQHWVFFSSYNIPSGGVSCWTYWSIVLEETSNRIYFVDQRFNTGACFPSLTIGVQIDNSEAYQVTGSPNIINSAGLSETDSDNGYWEFIYGSPQGFSNIGGTTYDLQTNNAICRRIVNVGNGDIVATWTYSTSYDITASDRGTGYCFYNGSSWSAAPSARIENQRTGWPNLGITRSGTEFVISHTVSSGLNIATRQPYGSGSWSNNIITGDPLAIWARTANVGDTIYVIASRQTGDSFNGLDGGLALFRSWNQGSTWTGPDSIPGVNASNFPNVGGDSYAIGAKDNVVAFVVGVFQPTLFKSTDYGSTWSMTVLVNITPDPLFSGQIGETLDSVVTGDEAYSILIDQNDVAHIWYGRNVVLDNDPGTAGWSYFPYNNGIMYWNDNTGGTPVLIEETVIADDTLDVDCVPTFPFNQDANQAYFSNITSMPSSGIDANGNLYVTYSALRDWDLDGNGAQLRSVYLIKSTDGGATWIGPYNVSQNAGEEAMFGSMARLVDDSVRIIYQVDLTPGTAVQDQNGPFHPYVMNDIWYTAVYINDIIVIETVLDLSTSNNEANCGSSDGDATVHAVGSGPFTYIWSNGATDSTATNLSAGTYSVTVGDLNGCQDSISLIVGNIGGATVSLSSSSDATCNGGTNGSISINVTGGTPSYSYSWSNGATTQNISGIAAGTYTVTVTDANTCLTFESYTISEPTAISIGSTVNHVTCNGNSDGDISLSVSGGTPSYTYSWSTGSTNSSISGLTGGSYTTTVTDGASCQEVQNITVNEPGVIAITKSNSNVSCYGGSDGTATAFVNGGTLPFSYSWSTGDTVGGISGLTAGSYNFTITDVNGCNDTAIFSISQPSMLTVSITGNNISCNGANDGSASTTVTGGTTNYSYSWNTGATSSSISGLTAGSYYVTVTDAQNCTSSDTVVITSPAALSLSGSGTDVSCNGSSDGTATVTPTGGTSPYTYSWSNGATVTVTDDNGCTDNTSVTVSQPSVLSLSTSQTDVSCNGGNDGVGTVTPSGGVAPYLYTWTSGHTTQLASSLSAGSYTVIVTDDNNCNVSTSITITEPGAMILSTSTTDATCGASDGTATVTATNGTSPYTYSWINGQITQTATGLSASSYSVTVTDNNGCSALTTASVNDAGAPTVTLDSYSDVSCNGDNDGTINVSVSGGTSPYAYSWSNGTTIEDLINVVAGTYSLTVTDNNGCVGTISQVITEPTAISLITGSINSSCGNSDGWAFVIASGGSPPYSYLWGNGQTTDTAVNLFAGNYLIVVTDSNGCQTHDLVAVSVFGAPTISTTVIDISCFGDADGAASVAASGGTPPYSYSWNTGSTNALITNLSGGSYAITVTDSNGCIASDIVVVSEPTEVDPVVTSNDVSCYAKNDGSANVNVTGGLSPYSYLWSNGATTASITGLSAGNFTVTVTDDNSCTAIDSINILEPDPLGITTTASDDSVTANVTGGTAPYTYLWSDGQTGQTAYELAPGNYIVTVTDANGCPNTATATVTGIDKQFTGRVLRVYPNPTEGSFYINISTIDKNDMELEIFNLLGNRIYHQTVPAVDRYEGHIDLREEPSGMYFLRITMGGMVDHVNIILTNE